MVRETLAQVFSCEFCEISKNTFSSEHLLRLLLLILSSTENTTVKIGDSLIKTSNTKKFLGTHFDNSLSLGLHLSEQAKRSVGK